MSSDMQAVANAAPYHLTTSLDACPLERFWVVLLDCHIEVYQNDKCMDLDEPDPWMRLKKFCQEQNARIMHMALAYKDRDDASQISLQPMSDGYFYSERSRRLIHPVHTYNDHSIGVGQLFDDKLQIVWTLDNGQTEVEVRDLSKLHPKHSTLPQLIRDNNTFFVDG